MKRFAIYNRTCNKFKRVFSDNDSIIIRREMIRTIAAPILSSSYIFLRDRPGDDS